ncbi:MAG: assimilatory sulfite reductase (NADPH) flavoprotein subunit, partial [Gammaproteobacteria bacterium]|nr:assimilatory sulfite reductase (NADPH) flavoprotein subunit [Gammaproteobacteria bacterium]
MTSAAAGSVTLPLNSETSAALQRAVAGFSPAQLQWASGYIAGLAVAAEGAMPARAAVAPDPANALTILFGSQTGNGQELAARLADRAREQGFAVNLKNLAEFKATNLKRESLVAFVISTHGEGDPPDDAELFHEFILSSRAARLPQLQYAVLALGDSSYVNFCQTGRELDARLTELGAERVQPLLECDLDYEAAAAAWTANMVSQLPEILQVVSVVPHLRAVAVKAQYDKHNPYAAEVLVNQKITAATSSKDVRHIELSVEGSGLHYEPGDSLAVIASNPPRLVEQIREELNLDGIAIVEVAGEATTLQDALSSKLEITVTSLGFLRAWAEFSEASQLRQLLLPESRQELAAFVESYQIIDVIREFPAAVSAEEFLSSLRKLSPRSYSIASSQAANPDEVHLTVAEVRYNAFGSEHWGAASTYLVDRVETGKTVSVYIESNPRFRLPEDDKPIVMIGAGTGVAPFRAFVEERAERGATGKNWLFFGDRNFCSDFLYQLEWQRHLKEGHLHKLEVAFSRDQAEKIYVQQRIRENSAELYSWLEQGAVVYVCGDAAHMAGDVDDAIVDVIAAGAGVSRDDALERLKLLRREGRYQRDV